MSDRWTKWFSVRNWPAALKLALGIAAIFLVGQAATSLVGDWLVRDSLIQGEQRELLERAILQAELVHDARDSYIRELYAAARRDRQILLQGEQGTSRMLLVNEQVRIGLFADLSVLDENGQVLASSSVALEGQDYASAPWFENARAQQAGISHLQAAVDTDEPTFVLHVPVPNEAQEEAGYSSLTLMARLPASQLWYLTDRIRVRDSGYAFMADENAVAIAHGLRDSETDQPTHQFVLYSIGEPADPHILEANQQRLYGAQEITLTVRLQTLADFIRGVPLTATPEDPAPSIHRYYWDKQKTWKTVVAIAVGQPGPLEVPHSIGPKDWILCITVSDNDFLAPVTQLRQGLLITSGIVFLLLLADAIGFGILFTRPVRRLASLTARVRQGAYDERVHLKQQDEVGQLARGINAMLDRLVEAMAAQQRQMATLLQTADTVSHDAGTVSVSAEELAAATEELNASAEEVAATVQSIAQDAYAQMDQVQRTAGEIQELDREIGRVAELSQHMEGSSAHMRATAEATEEAVAAAREHSRRIEAVVRLIEKSSRQTNMLALNATIEAARAGEMGESFTVVADEVRRLAESSRQALTEVRALNEAIRGSMDTINGAMGQTKEAIVEVVSMAAGMVQTASRQAEASRSLVEAINQLAGIAEKNAAASEEMASAVEGQTAAFEEVSTASQEMAGLALRLQALAQQLVPAGSPPEEGAQDGN